MPWFKLVYKVISALAWAEEGLKGWLHNRAAEKPLEDTKDEAQAFADPRPDNWADSVRKL